MNLGVWCLVGWLVGSFNISPSANNRDVRVNVNHIFSNQCTEVGTTYKEHVH